tara:strand:+ start:1977 stop:4697 length:2721 start_codon:yes stop_codon:yes gene_type:complete
MHNDVVVAKRSMFKWFPGVVLCQILLVLILVGTLSGISVAAEYWVTNLNGDKSYGSFLYTLSRAQDGDTVRFAPHLSGTITLDKGVFSASDISYIDSEDVTISASGDGSLALLSLMGKLQGTISGDLFVASSGNTTAMSAQYFDVESVSGGISAKSTEGWAAGLWGNQDIDLDSLSATVSAVSDKGAAYAVYARNTLNIREMSGNVTAESSNNVAYGIFSTGTADITELSGNVTAESVSSSANGVLVSWALSVANVSGNVSATSLQGDARGLHSQDMTVDKIDGSILVTAEAGSATGISGSNLRAADDSATVITGDGLVSARGHDDATAIVSINGLNLEVFGTLYAEDVSGRGNAYAIQTEGTSVADRVFLGDGAHVTGIIDLAGGSNYLTMDGSGTMNGDIKNITTLTKSGSGTWSTKGSVETHDLAVDSGTLLVNVAQTAQPSIQASGTVTNNGTIFFAPSASIARGETFTVLSSATLEGNGGFSYSPVFEGTVSGNNLELTKLSFAEAAGGANPNAEMLAAAFDANYSTASPELQSLFTTLEQASRADFDQSLDEMTTLHTGITTSMSVDTAQLVSVATQTRMAEMRTYQTMLAESRQSPDPDDSETWPMVASIGDMSGVLSRSSEYRPNSLYLRAMGRTGSMDTHGGYDGYSYDSMIFSGGYDRMLGDNFLAGISAGYAETEADYKDVGDSGSTLESYTLGMYGSWFEDGWYVDGILAGAYNEYDINRQLSAMGTTAKSSPSGYSLSAKTEAGYRFDMGGYGLTPIASLEYTRFHQDGYTESGAGVANLIIDDMDSNFLESGIGGKFDRTWVTDSFHIIPEVSLMWMHEWLNQSRDVTYSMTGMPGTAFSQKTAEGANDSLRLSAALRTVFESGFSAAVRYQGEVEEHGRSHSLMLEGQWAF